MLAYPPPEFYSQVMDMSHSHAGESARLSESTSTLTHADDLDHVTHAFAETCLDTLSVYYCTALASAIRSATSCGSNGARVQVGTLRSEESHVDSTLDAVTGFQNGGSSGRNSSSSGSSIGSSKGSSNGSSNSSSTGSSCGCRNGSRSGSGNKSSSERSSGSSSGSRTDNSRAAE